MGEKVGSNRFLKGSSSMSIGDEEERVSASLINQSTWNHYYLKGHFII